MAELQNHKVTFYADADVKKWLDKLGASGKSRKINELLRMGFEKGDDVLPRLDALEAKMQVMQKDLRNDGFTIAAMRRVMMNRFGERATEELEKEFNDILYSSPPVEKPTKLAPPGEVKKLEPTSPPKEPEYLKEQGSLRGFEQNPPAGFDRFTEKALKVIFLAQEESRRLGHNFVGTEQILLGSIGESTGVAAKALKSLGVNVKDARVEVEKIIGRGSGFVAVEIPFTPRAKRVLDLAWSEAKTLKHDYIGTEHLLLGVIEEGEGVAVRVLENLGLDPAKVRSKVLKFLQESP
jgi:hypothetical protein